MRYGVNCSIRLVGLLFTLLGCQFAVAESISISGSTTVQKYIKLAAVAYQKAHPDMSFNIGGGGSTAGFAQVVDGRIHIGMMSRDVRSEEKLELEQANIQVIPIALDAVVPVVSDEVYAAGVHDISLQQLADIYQGKLKNWHDLGAEDSQIIVVDKNAYHGTRAVFSTYVLGEAGVPNPDVSVILDSDDDIVRLLQSSDQAIAYVGIGFLNGLVQGLNLKVDGKIIAPSYISIRNGHYPMSRQLCLLVAKSAPGFVHSFVAYMLSPEGQELAEQAGYLPLK